MPEHPLRCWEECGQDPLRRWLWRVILEEPYTGERHGFADLAQRVAFWQGVVRSVQDGAKP